HSISISFHTGQKTILLVITRLTLIGIFASTPSFAIRSALSFCLFLNEPLPFQVPHLPS
ncbi:45661_t:CDS:1, partial [Gigaspora margarita]